VITGLWERGAECETIRLVDLNILPSVNLGEGDGDEWPGREDPPPTCPDCGGFELRPDGRVALGRASGSGVEVTVLRADGASGPRSTVVSLGATSMRAVLSRAGDRTPCG
jgi:hypothetical protein